jgi:hypothetical protein
MALEAVLDTVEGLEQNVASLYVQDSASGKWRLDVNGGFKTLSEIEGLSSALGKERGRADAAEKALKALQGRYEGYDVEAGKAAIEKVARMTEDQKAREAQWEQNLQQRLGPVQKERDEALARLKDAEARYDSMLVDRALADSAFIRDKVSKDPIHQSYVREHFRSAFKVEDGRIVAYDQSGQKVFGTDGQPADVDTALSRFVNALPNGQALLAGSTASGSGASAGTGGMPAGAKTMKLSHFDALSPAEQMKAVKSGIRIVD